MFCHLCGAKIEKGDSFCRTCGEESMALAVPNTHRVASVGHFFLGTLLFATVFLATSFLLSVLFPASGPQLVILTLLVFASLLAGASSVLYMKLRKPRTKRGQDKEREIRPPQFDTEVRQLSEERFMPVPASIVDSTTSKLRVER